MFYHTRAQPAEGGAAAAHQVRPSFVVGSAPHARRYVSGTPLASWSLFGGQRLPTALRSMKRAWPAVGRRPSPCRRGGVARREGQTPCAAYCARFRHMNASAPATVSRLTCLVECGRAGARRAGCPTFHLHESLHPTPTTHHCHLPHPSRLQHGHAPGNPVWGWGWGG